MAIRPGEDLGQIGKLPENAANQDERPWGPPTEEFLSERESKLSTDVTGHIPSYASAYPQL